MKGHPVRTREAVVDESLFLKTILESGLAHCRVVVDDHGGLLISLFMAGLVGGPTHCVGMCGPFVLSQVTARLEDTPAAGMREWHRLSGAALVPYHLGRLTTYVLLGAAAALMVAGATAFGGFRWLSAGLLSLAALFFIGYALRGLLPRLPRFGGDAAREGAWSRRLGDRARPLFARPVGWRGYALGVALGFLPCGLLYGALAAAASGSDPLAGAFAMTAFGLGTVPSLIGVGLAGHVAGQHWRGALARIAPVLLVINAGILGTMAWRLLAA